MRVAGFKRRLMSSATLIALFAGATVLASASPAFAVCADDSLEDDDSAAQATALFVPTVVSGQMCADDADYVRDFTWTSVDWFSVTAEAGQVISADLSWTPGVDLDVYLLDSDEQPVNGSLAVSNDPPEQFAHTAGVSGTYYILVLGWEGAETPYDMFVDVTAGGGGSPNAFQQTSVNAIAPDGLSVTVQNQNVFFGDLAASVANTVAVGDIYYSNTLGNGQPWSATVAATSLVNGGSHIPFSNMSFEPGTNISPAGPVAGGGALFTGSDGTPGESFSDPVTLITGGSTDQGSFTQSDSVTSLLMPETVQAGSYSGIFQYTITG